MADYGAITMPPSDRALSRKTAIVGIGETDYGADYQAERTRPEGWVPPTEETLLTTAFERALADSGLKREDIDGITTSFTYGGPPADEVAKMLGVKARFAQANGNIMAGPLPVACAAIAEGKADTIAMLFAVASRSAGRLFGGMTHSTGGTPDPDEENRTPSSYYYYHPWGWSSQAAHWALIFGHYQWKYGVGEEDLFHVARQVREHAMAQPNAVMRKELTLEAYMGSRYITRPLHLFDICIVNDGAVCLIVRRADLARDLAHTPVDVAGWGHAKVKKNKMHVMVREQLRPQLQEASAQALAMAGVSLAEVQHFEGYDASSFHLINQVEGIGFTEPGTGLAFCRDGQMTVGGRIPTNTSGGNLSQAYMQGWSQVAEAVRQLRGEAGQYQVPGAQVSMTNLAQTDQTHPIVFVRGDR
ncbi:MAG: thiolase family protein [Novosphingobium sp.]|nr:MAG: thiolase family protein [Novosphingobium sp.]